MTTINYLSADGERHTLDLDDGMSVMEGAVSNGIDGIVGECGGNAMCATCHVYVEPSDLERLAPMEDFEDDMLESAASERRSNSRLSCQIEVSSKLEGLTVHMPPSQY